jgi:membrane protein DedA with SNARE-associated domain
VTPPQKPDRRVLVWCGVPLAVLTVAGFLGTAFMPYLLARRPLVLVVLSPLFRHLVVVAPRVDPVAFFAVAVPRHFLPDPFVYMLGREYGHLAAAWADENSPVTGKIVRAFERLFAKVGPFALLVSPDIIVSTLAGAARVPVPVFVVFNIVGTFGTVFVARWFGGVFDKPIAAMVAFFEAHLVLVTCVSVVLVVFFNWYSRREVPETPGKGTDPGDLRSGPEGPA